MQLMVVGDKWEMYIPSEIAYGDYGSPPKIGPGEVLIFQMEMLASTYPSPPPAFAWYYRRRRRRVRVCVWLDTMIYVCCLDVCVVLWIVDFVVAPPSWELIRFSRA